METRRWWFWSFLGENGIKYWNCQPVNFLYYFYIYYYLLLSSPSHIDLFTISKIFEMRPVIVVIRAMTALYFLMLSIVFFTNAQNSQYWHYCQHCMAIYLQFPSLFTKNDVSKYENRNQQIQSNTFQGCRLYWSSSFLIAKLKQSWQYCHSSIVESWLKSLLKK